MKKLTYTARKTIIEHVNDRTRVCKRVGNGVIVIDDVYDSDRTFLSDMLKMLDNSIIKLLSVVFNSAVDVVGDKNEIATIRSIGRSVKFCSRWVTPRREVHVYHIDYVLSDVRGMLREVSIMWSCFDDCCMYVHTINNATTIVVDYGDAIYISRDVYDMHVHYCEMIMLTDMLYRCKTPNISMLRYNVNRVVTLSQVLGTSKLLGVV